jgi:hypothetical protein
MKKFLTALFLVLLLTVGTAFASGNNNQNNSDTYNDNRSYTTNNEGGKGGDADANALSVSSSKADADATAINLTNVEVKQGPMNQGQIAINEGNDVNVEIKNEKQFLAAPSTSAPEVNHGSGKVRFGFDELKFGIPLYNKNKEDIKSLITEKHNIKTDDLIATILKMKKAEGQLTYNTRLVIIQKEAQKSYAVSIIGAPAGSGMLGTTGVSGSAVVGPSFSGTKANDLFSVYLVKVQ